MMRHASVTGVPQPTGPQYATHGDFCTLHELVKDTNDLLGKILLVLAEQRLRPAINTNISINNVAPTNLIIAPRRHNRLWLAASQAVLIDNLTGGFVSFNLVAGWNPLDVVEGARVQLASGGPVAALFQCTDVEISGVVA